MSRFKVVVEHTVHIPVTVEVDSIEEAEEKALVAAQADPAGSELVHTDIFTLVEVCESLPAVVV